MDRRRDEESRLQQTWLSDNAGRPDDGEPRWKIRRRRIS